MPIIFPFLYIENSPKNDANVKKWYACDFNITGLEIISTKFLENVEGVNPATCLNGIAFAINSNNNNITENIPIYSQVLDEYFLLIFNMADAP